MIERNVNLAERRDNVKEKEKDSLSSNLNSNSLKGP